MTATRTRYASMAAAALLALGMAGCGSTTPPEGPEPERDPNPSILERGELDRTAVTMEELLVGHLPGVEVRRVPGGLSVLIRGLSSFSTSNEALIIIDGVQTSGTVLAGVNPEDVQRVEVIKDGAAALYGLRGANGVLIVTTRRR